MLCGCVSVQGMSLHQKNMDRFLQKESPQQKELLHSDPNDLIDQEIELEVSLQSTSASYNLATNSSISSDTSLTSENDNPWPYIDKYFQFKGHQGRNVLFECMQCLPIHKVISTSRKSRNNLKKHLGSKHSYSLKEFDTCCLEGSKASKIKKRQAPYDDDNKKQKGMHQLTVLDTMAGSSVGKVISQATSEDRLISESFENMLPSYIGEIKLEVISQSASASDNQPTNSSISNDIFLTPENDNPWPHISKYFRFKGHQGCNVLFECMQCLPTHKVISTSRKSRNNLKKHLGSKHSYSLKEFDTCFLEGSKAFKMKKRQAPYDKGDSKQQKGVHQLTILDTMAGSSIGKVISQASIKEGLINVFVENMLPLDAVEIGLENSSQSASASDNLATSCSISSNVSLIQKNDNPWPHITKYFQFKGHQGDNVLFECMQCLPTHKVISTSRKSRSNLKKHLGSKHSYSLKEFDTCFLEGSKASKMKKQQAPYDEGDTEKQKGIHQLTILDTMAGSSVGKVISQATFEDRLTHESENMLPSHIGKIKLELISQSASASNNQSTNYNISSDISLTPENYNPWPHITKYFRFKGHQRGNVLFECMQCLPTHKVISTSCKSRNNLKKHLGSKHSYSLKEFDTCFLEGSKASKMKKRQAPYDEGNNKKQKGMQQLTILDSSRGKAISQATFEDRLTNVFVENMLPLHIVESDSFKSLLQLVPANHNMSRRSLTRVIESRFQSEKERLKDILHKLPSVATTADAWTCRNRSYLGMTVHWIDQPSLKRMKAVLACQCLKGCHTHNTVAKAIQDIHVSFGIENKVRRTTTDNGSNFIKAFNYFRKQESVDDHEDEDTEDVVQVEEMAMLLEEQPQNDPGYKPYDLPKHSRCTAHTLNFIATTDADKAFNKSTNYKKANQCAFAKAKELWNKQHKSSQASDTIKDEVGKPLVVPTLTRWNSVYNAVICLVDIFDNKDMLSGLEKACNSFKIPCFTTADMTFLREYHQVMEPVAKAFDILQREEWAYMGTLLPTIAICLKTLKEQRNSHNISVCQPLVEALIDGLMNRFGHLFNDMEYLLSTALNPKFKLAFWPQWLIDDTLSVEEMKRRVTNQLVSLLEKACNKEDKKSTSGSELEAEQPEEDKVKGEDDYFKALYDSRRKSEDTGNLVRYFLEEGPEKNINSYVFPCKALLDLFIRFNTPIPSSAAVGRLFSMGKDALKPKQAGLSDDHLEMLVFLMGNK